MLTGKPAAAKKAPRRVTKAAAREAYYSLQWTVNDLRGHTNVELLRVDVPASLEPKMATVRDLMVSGWPDGATGDPDLTACLRPPSRSSTDGSASTTMA